MSANMSRMQLKRQRKDVLLRWQVWAPAMTKSWRWQRKCLTRLLNRPSLKDHNYCCFFFHRTTNTCKILGSKDSVQSQGCCISARRTLQHNCFGWSWKRSHQRAAKHAFIRLERMWVMHILATAIKDTCPMFVKLRKRKEKIVKIMNDITEQFWS